MQEDEPVVKKPQILFVERSCFGRYTSDVEDEVGQWVYFYTYVNNMCKDFKF